MGAVRVFIDKNTGNYKWATDHRASYCPAGHEEIDWPLGQPPGRNMVWNGNTLVNRHELKTQWFNPTTGDVKTFQRTSDYQPVARPDHLIREEIAPGEYRWRKRQDIPDDRPLRIPPRITEPDAGGTGD